MKQPGLDELRKALSSDDPLDIVNAFVRCQWGEERLPEYWNHRVCAFAEMITAENARLRRQVERLVTFGKLLIHTIDYEPTLEGSLQRQDFETQLDAILADEPGETE